METSMQRLRALSTALLFLTFAGSTVAHAQRDRDKQQKQQPPVPARVTPAEQQRRTQQEQQRATQYKQHLDQQVPVVQQQAAQLQHQKRAAQYRTQQDYAARLQQQQQSLQTARDYSGDPYVSAPRSYRYVVSGTARQTNQYGADVLRQAVNDGYQEGVQTGKADRADHWKSNYQSSIAYRDANYGYTGNYVDQADYNYYFRQGFRRGYDDGYNSQSRYGSISNGTPTILGSLLSSILGLQSIR
jgi:hypothetical protein